LKYLFVLCLSCIIAGYSSAQSGFSRDTNIPVSTPSGQLNMPWAGGINSPNFSEIDLNGDNIPDMFSFDRSNNHIITYVNTGTGGQNCWRYAPQYADMFPPIRSWAFLYDYDLDGKPDVFTCNFANNGISQYRNVSVGQSLQFILVDSTMKYNTGSQLANMVASANLPPNFNDIDGDGDMDIIGHTFQCVGVFVHYINMSVEHYGVPGHLDDFVIEHNVWGAFGLRLGAFTNVAVGSWNINCPIFAPPPVKGDENPYQYEEADKDDTYASIYTIDIDGDGDKDALIGDSGAKNSLLVINGGNPDSAHMVSQDTSFPSYDLSVNNFNYTQHAYLDCDNDGVKDLLVSNIEYKDKNNIYFYKNTNTTAVPILQFTINNFLQDQMIDVGEAATPVLVDADGDGLKDLLIGNRYLTVNDTTKVTSIVMFKNTGTATSPAFSLVNTDFAGLSSMNLPGQIFPAFGDLDQDNDLDMLIGLDDGTIVYFENNAGPGAPMTFNAPVYSYCSIDVGQACAPQLVDLKRDGYIDLVCGNKNGLIQYFENTHGSTPFSAVPSNDTLGNITLHYPQSTDGYTVPFFFDQNGDYRLAVSYMEGYVYLYGNIDNNLNGSFTPLDTIINLQEGFRYGYNLSVSGADLNGDTLTDLVFGLYSGGVQVYYQDNLANGVSEVETNNELSIYPNPASDRLVIKTHFNDGQCSLLDIAGRVVINSKVQSGFSILNVNDVAEGTYFVRVVSNGKITNAKLLISR
jgi:hypothetical protein